MAGTNKNGRARRIGAMGMLTTVLVLPGHGLAQVWTLTPTLRLRASHTDNFYLAPEAQAQGETIGEVAPGFTLMGGRRRLNANIAYQLQRLNYSHQTDTTRHHLQAAGHVELLEDWLFLDARASISRQNVSAFGGQIADPSDLAGVGGTVRMTGVVPTLRHQVPGLFKFTVRAAREQASGADGHIQARSDSAAFDIDNANSGQRWGWHLQGRRQTERNFSLAPVRLTSVSAALRYAPTPRVSFELGSGREDNDYQAINQPAQGRSWYAGVNWRPSVRTAISASVGKRFFGNSVSLDASVQASNSVWRMAYGEQIASASTQLLALGENQTVALLDALWTPRLADPAARRAAIDTFILAARLQDPELANINFLSRRYYLQKRWSGSFALGGKHQTLVLSVVSDTRTAQSVSALDGAAAPTDSLLLLEHTRQRGASAAWSWQATSRGSVNAGASWTQARSLSSGRSDSNVVLRGGVTHAFNAKLSSSVELRRARHASSGGGAYHEQTINATINLHF